MFRQNGRNQTIASILADVSHASHKDSVPFQFPTVNLVSVNGTPIQLNLG